MTPAPDVEEAGAHAGLIRDVVALLERNAYRQAQLAPYVPQLVDTVATACGDAATQSAMAGAIERFVRRRRLPGYWLAYLFQLAMQRRTSPFFVAGCRLYAEAQINFNEDLALSSLENGFNAAAQLEAVAGGDALAAVTADLRRRLRQVYGYYRRWYGSTDPATINQLSEHLYFDLTLTELRLAYPTLDKPWTALAAADFQHVLAASSGNADDYHRVVAGRFYGMLLATNGRFQDAAAQFQRALDAARGAKIDTEEGHLHRLLGHALVRCDALGDAVAAFERAVAHEAHPRCSYWRALSERELGDAWMHAVQGEIDPRNPPPQLARALDAYRAGLADFDAHVVAGVVPVARGIEQQMLRSYTANAVQAAMLSNPRDTLAEFEGLGPRLATDTVAEGRAAASAPAQTYAAFRRARGSFGQDLMLFDLHSDADADFAAYLGHIVEQRADRQRYLQTRVAATGAIAAAQRSSQNAQALLGLRIAGTVFVALHMSERQIVCVLVDAETGAAASASAAIDAAELRARHAAFHAVVAASLPPSPRPDVAMTRGLDDLLAFYATTLGGLFEAFLPLIKDKRVKIFPHALLHEVPLHAISVAGVPLAAHCDVSYAPTLGAFLQAHAGSDAPGRTPLAVHDAARTPFYAATMSILSDANAQARVLAMPSWETFAASLAGAPPSDVIFACHGRYDADDPRKSLLWLTASDPVPFTKLFADLDLSGCRCVLMGACESGLGRTLLSSEYIGLPLAFLAAGARYVIGSLWQVNQLASAILVSACLSAMQRSELTVASALAWAQRETMGLSQDGVVAWLWAHLPEMGAMLEPGIRAMGPQPFAHPYYWAGFYAVGDV